MYKFIYIIVFLSGTVTGILIHGMIYQGEFFTNLGIIILFIVIGVIGTYTIKIRKRLNKADEKINLITNIDGITGVYDRIFFFEMFETELDRAMRYKRKISCLLIDVDGFKRINESYGFRAGDTVLQHIAEILKDNMRISDIVARYAIDQFICVLPETETEPALIIAKRLVALFQGTKIHLDEKDDEINITASIGVTAWKPSEEKQFDAAGMIAMAEKAVLLAKSEGGNRVDCYIV